MFRRVRSRRHAYERSLRSPAFLAVLAGVVVASLFMAAMLRPTYLREIETGRERAAIVARLVEEHTLRNFQAVDFTLQRMIEASRDLAENDAAFRETLKRRLGSMPYVRALFIIGPDGFIAHDTDFPATPRVSLADRDYFHAHQADASAGLHVSPPLMSRSVGRWFVSVSRRMSRPDGSFAGVAVAAVEPAHYDKLYAELKLHPADIVGLLHQDGTLIARMPKAPELVGTIRRGLGHFREQVAPHGTFIANDFGDGRARIVGFRHVEGTPLVAAAALSQDALLASWRTATLTAVASFVLLAALALATTLVLIRRAIERREARRRAAAVVRLQTLGRMTGGVAHDFNNLIAAIGAGLTLAEKHAADPGKLRSCLAAARDAADRATRLAGQLLAFAKRQQLDVKPADANSLLLRLQPMLQQAAGPGVAFTFDLAPNLPACRADHIQFDAAVLNLVLNARDAMKPGGGRIEISTSDWIEPKDSPTLRPGHYVCVRVSDTGPGFPEEHIERVFEPFFSTKGEGGTGLGLSQVYGVMQQVGGIVRVFNRASKGASVELLFPQADAADAADVATSDAADPPADSALARLARRFDAARRRRGSPMPNGIAAHSRTGSASVAAPLVQPGAD